MPAPMGAANLLPCPIPTPRSRFRGPPPAAGRPRGWHPARTWENS